LIASSNRFVWVLQTGVSRDGTTLNSRGVGQGDRVEPLEALEVRGLVPLLHLRADQGDRVALELDRTFARRHVDSSHAGPGMGRNRG
jgi:hypothetical protein